MAEPSDRYALVGTIVADKYAIERVVGEGGFGVVFRATHRIWDEPVALKCFTALSNAPVEVRDELLDQFVQEGKLLSKLSSRTTGIVQARDIGTLTTPGGAWLPYMVLEWLDGRTLEAFLGHDDGVARGKPRGVLETFQIMDGAVRALALAHALGVAHRDIKPANFFALGEELVPGMVIKVLDFGIAKVMQTQGTQNAATGLQISSFTPNYGAPEQFDRSYGATGPWTDVFQMALVILEVLRGGLPSLGGEQFMQLAFASQNPDRRPTPRLFGLGVSDEVEAVFKKAVALKVVDRYQNMAEFWMALAGALGLRDYPPLPTADSLLLTTGLPPPTGTTTSRAVSALVATPVTQRPGTPMAGPATKPTIVNSAGPGVKRPGNARTIAVAAALALVAGGAAFAVVQSMKPPAPPEEKKAEVVAPPQQVTKVVTPPAPPPTPCPEGMALIEGGRFFMGTDMLAPVLAAANPAHKVEVKRFCIDLREVTTAEYEACSKAGECKRAFKESYWPQGSMKKGDWEKARTAYSALCNAETDRAMHPINCVIWAQADEYCKVQKKRLPSEAEFEFAARGSDGRVFPWGDAPPDEKHLNACGAECVAWRKTAGLPAVSPLYTADDGFPGTAPVGSFPDGKTQGGLLDVVGNVFEWTADVYKPYARPDGGDPAMPPHNNRVIRGGAFNSFEKEHADPALRLPYDADAHTHGIGFRCAMDPRS